MSHTLVQFADVWSTSLWRAAWQGAIAIAAVWAIARFCTFLSPRIVCWLWRLACLKLLVALVWAAPVNLPLLPARLPATQSPAMPPPVVEFTPIEPFVEPPVIAAPAAPLPVRVPISTAEILFAAWGVGVACCVLRTLWQWHTLRALLRTARSANDPLWQICRDEATRMRIVRLPQLRLSSRVESPMLTGVWRPTIVLPENIEQAFDEADIRLMMAHELSHLKRRDLAWNWLPTVALWLFYFHPLVWLLIRRWSESQEAACDELLIQQQAAQPAAYGRLLLKLSARASAEPRAALAAAGVLGAYRNLERRLLALARVRPFSSRRLAVSVGLLGIVALLSLVPWRLVAQQPSDSTKPTAAAPAENLKSVQYVETRKNLNKEGQVEEVTEHRVKVLGRHLKRGEFKTLEARKLKEGEISGTVTEPYVTIDNAKTGKTISFFPEKKGFVVPRGNLGITDKGEIEEGKIEPHPEIDFYAHIHDVPIETAKPVQDKLIDGKTVNGFEVIETREEMGGISTWTRTYWIDPATKLPVQIEIAFRSTSPRMSNSDFVVSDIVFDKPLDEALFSTEPPEGYKNLVTDEAEKGAKAQFYNVSPNASTKTAKDPEAQRVITKLRDLGANVMVGRGDSVTIGIKQSWKGTGADLALLNELPKIEVLQVDLKDANTLREEIKEAVEKKRANPKLLDLAFNDVDATAFGSLKLKGPIQTLLIYNLSDESLNKIATLPQCRSLMLTDCALSERGSKRLAQMAEGIERLTLTLGPEPPGHPSANRKLGDSVLEGLGQIHSLKKIDLFALDITDAGLAHLASLDNLESLSIAECPRVHGEGFASLARLKTLLQSPTPVTSEGLRAISQLSQLQTLVLALGEVQPAEVVALSKLRELRTLNITDQAPDGDAYKKLALGNAILRAVADLPKLNGVTIYGIAVGDDGLEALGAATQLQSLFIDAVRVTERGLKAIEPLKELKSLSIHGEGVTDDGLRHFAGLESLESLYLSGDALTGTGLAALANLKKLKTLWIGNSRFDDQGSAALAMLPSLESLSIAGAKITDRAFASIAKLPHLRQLTLSDNSVPVEGLMQLRESKSLKQLVLPKQELPKEELAKLKKALPRVEVTRWGNWTGSAHLYVFQESESEESDKKESSNTFRQDNSNSNEASAKETDQTTNSSSAQRALDRLKELGAVPASANQIGIQKDWKGTDADLRLVNDLPDLEWLYLDLEEHVSIEALKEVQPKQAIRRLILGALSDEMLAKLDRLPHCHTLMLPLYKLSAQGFARLAQLPDSIERLELISEYPGTEGISDDGLQNVGKIRNLKGLQIVRTGITDAGLAHLASLDKLEELELGECWKIRGPGYASLASIKSLRNLTAYSMQIDGDALQSLAKLTQLTSMTIQPLEELSKGDSERLRAALAGVKIKIVRYRGVQTGFFDTDENDIDAARDQAQPAAAREAMAAALVKEAERWITRKEYGRAKASFEEASRISLEKSELSIIVSCNLAWLLATCPDDKLRDGARAVELAQRACEQSGWKDYNILDTFAAASAETGNFDAAVKWQGEAIKLAPQNPAFQQGAEKRLALYREKKPYRDAPSPDTSNNSSTRASVGTNSLAQLPADKTDRDGGTKKALEPGAGEKEANEKDSAPTATATTTKENAGQARPNEADPGAGELTFTVTLEDDARESLEIVLRSSYTRPIKTWEDVTPGTIHLELPKLDADNYWLKVSAKGYAELLARLSVSKDGITLQPETIELYRRRYAVLRYVVNLAGERELTGDNVKEGRVAISYGSVPDLHGDWLMRQSQKTSRFGFHRYDAGNGFARPPEGASFDDIDIAPPPDQYKPEDVVVEKGTVLLNRILGDGPRQRRYAKILVEDVTETPPQDMQVIDSLLPPTPLSKVSAAKTAKSQQGRTSGQIAARAHLEDDASAPIKYELRDTSGVTLKTWESIDPSEQRLDLPALEHDRYYLTASGQRYSPVKIPIKVSADGVEPVEATFDLFRARYVVVRYAINTKGERELTGDDVKQGRVAILFGKIPELVDWSVAQEGGRPKADVHRVFQNTGFALAPAGSSFDDLNIAPPNEEYTPDKFYFEKGTILFNRVVGHIPETARYAKLAIEDITETRPEGITIIDSRR